MLPLLEPCLRASFPLNDCELHLKRSFSLKVSGEQYLPKINLMVQELAWKDEKRDKRLANL